MAKIATAGNHGEKVRSDCQISIELKRSGGIQVELESKVKVLYGRRIRELVHAMMQHFAVENSRIFVKDSGALDWVIAARVEAAMRLLKKEIQPWLPERVPENRDPSSRDRFRTSRLYLPGNTPSMMINAGIHKPGGIILDLEDSVAPAKKAEARILVRNALRALNFYGAERMVRINPVPAGLEDLESVAGQGAQLILIPKCESAEQVQQVGEILKERFPKDLQVWFMPIIESALGVENAFETASSSDRIVAMALGLEDLTADLGVQRTEGGLESFYVRTRLVNACKAARIQAIDSVFSDVDNMDALADHARQSRALGFEGMGCIHPRQIPVVEKAFAPEPEELEKALKIVEAAEKAEKEGLGVVALGSKMVDAPVVKRARQTVEKARHFGLSREK